MISLDNFSCPSLGRLGGICFGSASTLMTSEGVSFVKFFLKFRFLFKFFFKLLFIFLLLFNAFFFIIIRTSIAIVFGVGNGSGFGWGCGWLRVRSWLVGRRIISKTVETEHLQLKFPFFLLSPKKLEILVLLPLLRGNHLNLFILPLDCIQVCKIKL